MKENLDIILAIVIPLMGMLAWMWHNLRSDMKDLRGDIKENGKGIAHLTERIAKIEGYLGIDITKKDPDKPTGSE